MKSVKDILADAIDREIEAYEFYKQVSERVADPTVKQMFNTLSQEELGHRDFLKNCFADADLITKIPSVPDYKVSESTVAPELSIEMKPVDAIALAMKKEQEAAEFYTQLAKSSNDVSFKTTFEGLARMELSHKAAMENAFVNIGYPEVF